MYLIQRNSNCWPFLEPVTKDIAPDYLDVIEKPMDISAIRKKSSKKEYFSKQQFVADFHLIVENCTKYNGVNSGKYNNLFILTIMFIIDLIYHEKYLSELMLFNVTSDS